MNVLFSPVWLHQAGLWGGILLAIFLLSTLVKENVLSRLAQHILVGAAVGYAVVLVLRDVLWHQYLIPLQRAPLDAQTEWIQLALFGLVLLAGTLRIFEMRPRVLTRAFSIAALTPIALATGFGIAAVAIGSVQGTLAPQFLRAAAIGFRRGEAPIQLLTGAITLVVTSGVLIHLRNNPKRDFGEMPVWLRSIFGNWAAIGARAIWLVAGVVFARLIASRLSLLIGQMQWLVRSIEETSIWQWLVTFF